MPTAQRRLGPLKARRLTCQWNRSSPVGPALHDVGGSFWRSCRRAGQSRGNGGGGVGRGGESPAHRSADDVEGVWVNRWVRSELESREREGRRKARHRGTEGSCWERGGGGGGSQQVGLPSPSTPSRVLSDHGQGRRSNQEAEPCMACSPGGARDDRSGGPGRGQERDSGRGMGRRRQKFLPSPSPPPPSRGKPCALGPRSPDFESEPIFHTSHGALFLRRADTRGHAGNAHELSLPHTCNSFWILFPAIFPGTTSRGAGRGEVRRGPRR